MAVTKLPGHERVWNIIIDTFDKAKWRGPKPAIIEDTTTGIYGVATEIWTVADGAVKIVVATSAVSAETVRETAARMEGELVELLKSAT